jgi:REP element-mobilizing transposase RayT
MLIAIPPKYAGSQVIGSIKGKSATTHSRRAGSLTPDEERGSL